MSYITAFINGMGIGMGLGYLMMWKTRVVIGIMMGLLLLSSLILTFSAESTGTASVYGAKDLVYMIGVSIGTLVGMGVYEMAQDMG